VSGAGDTVIAAFALALAGNLPPEQGAYLANLAASVVVAKVGTYAVSKEELLAVLEREGAHEP
jgi:D-beta-D-heptose 7-phosphate kinase/D-beta-D-heptose 1-phosphate adenosyltransferase